MFFPLGTLAGVVGVLLWPFHHAGLLADHPGVSHPRLMAHGFLGSFILGFLATAVPRFLGTPRLGDGTVGLMLAGQAAVIALHVAGWTAGGDLAFVGVLLLLLGQLGIRWHRRTELPPPGMVLAAIGVLAGVAGLLIGVLAPADESGAMARVVSGRLMFHTFLLLPVLGVGAYVMPALLGVPQRHEPPEGRDRVPAWSRPASLALAVGAVGLACVAVDAAGWWRTGWALRALLVAGYLHSQVPWLARGGRRTSVSLVLRIGLTAVPLGLAAAAVLARWAVGVVHLTLATGLVLVTLAVATRVVFGHGGHRDRIVARHRWYPVVTGLILLGTVTRISGDFLPAIQASHFDYGAVFWSAGVLLWAARVLPVTALADPGD